MEFTTLMSGSHGNCIYICGGKTKILIDVGCSCRYLEKALAEIAVNLSEIDAILVSHEHGDHVKGVPVCAGRYDIPVFASELTWRELPFYDDFMPSKRHKFTYDMAIGDLEIEFFKTYHDAVQPVGMVVHHQNHRVAVATDTGKVTQSMVDLMQGCDGIVLESNHCEIALAEGPYPHFLKKRIAGSQGHLSNRQSAQALSRIITDQTQAVMLAHLSETNNTSQIAMSEIHNVFSQRDFSYTCAVSVAKNRAASPLVKLV
ncbi:MAG: MBL fold metallo-hydrolase [Bacillota bacterium]|jgi:phosphoribosyl 1,2-cyclic phosphodiesterase